jgi:hypothetical protein
VARLRNGVTIDPAPARTATVRVRLDSPVEVTRLVNVGDRDQYGALVTAIDRDSIVVRLGAMPADDEWQYLGEDLKPGVTLTLTTKRYVVRGVVLNVAMEDKP